MRSQSKETLEAFYDLFLSECQLVGEERGVEFKLDRRLESAPATMDPGWVARLRAAARTLGLPDEEIPSGAGHDAAVFANAGIPSAMIFVRNENGSHNPDEAMTIDDFAVGRRGDAGGAEGGGGMSIGALFDAAKAAAKTTADVTSITIRRPDDWHVHLRDGAMLKAVLPFTAAQFARGIIMPNLVPPVTTVAAAAAYRERILAARPAGSDFQPLMTCYLTDNTSPDEIEKGFAEKRLGRGQTLSGRCDHQRPSRRDRYPRTCSGAGTHGEDRHAGADPWRGDRSGRRYFRPRGRLHGAHAAAAA